MNLLEGNKANQAKYDALHLPEKEALREEYSRLCLVNDSPCDWDSFLAAHLPSDSAEIAAPAIKKPKPPRIKRKQTKVQHGPQPKFKASWFRKAMVTLTGRKHQYQVTVRYNYEQDRDGLWPDRSFVSRILYVGLVDPAILHFNHELHKELAQPFIDSLPRHLKRNGLVQITNVSFLGVW